MKMFARAASTSDRGVEDVGDVGDVNRKTWLA